MTDWGRRERPLCPLDPLEEDHLEGVVVEDVEKETEIKTHLLAGPKIGLRRF